MWRWLCGSDLVDAFTSTPLIARGQDAVTMWRWLCGSDLVEAFTSTPITARGQDAVTT